MKIITLSGLIFATFLIVITGIIFHLLVSTYSSLNKKKGNQVFLQVWLQNDILAIFVFIFLVIFFKTGVINGIREVYYEYNNFELSDRKKLGGITSNFNFSNDLRPRRSELEEKRLRKLEICENLFFFMLFSVEIYLWWD